ncbi:hypothetical protein ACHWQZ_G009810 [Mnemiopsis leidyi]
MLLNCSSMPEEISLETTDRILGAFLIIFTTLGIYGNTLSLVFFKDQKSKNGNNLFYQKCYFMISGMDLLICLTQIPVIQTLVVGREKENLMFLDNTFCNVWGGTWAILQPLSAYLVLILSCCRLVVLVCPFKKLPLHLPHRLLLGCVIALFLLSSIPAFTGQFRFAYAMKQGHCFLTTELSESDNHQEKFNVETLSIIRNSFLCLPIPPILTVFVLSVYYLKQVLETSDVSTPTTRTHRYESKTIQIFTFTCLLCHIPLICYELLLALTFTASRDLNLLDSTIREFYLGFITQDVLTLANSAINPFIYLMRIKTFRRFVGEWGNAKSVVVSRISSMSFSAGRSSLVKRLSKISTVGQHPSRLSFFSTASNVSHPSGIIPIPELKLSKDEDSGEE